MKAEGNAGKLADAAKLADEARKLAPDEPLFECLAGEIQLAQERGDKGRAHFEKARSLQSKAGGAREYWKPAFYLGVVAVDAGRGAEAADFLKRACELYPEQPVAAYYLGRAEELRNDPKAAAAAYQRVTELAPEDSTLYQKSAERLAALRAEMTKPTKPAKPGVKTTSRSTS